MTWGPTPAIPTRNPRKAWFPTPPFPVDPVPGPYWYPYLAAVGLAAQLRPLVAHLEGSVGMDGQLAAALPALVGHLEGELIIDGQLAGAMRALRGALTNIITSDLAGQLAPMRAAILGSHDVTGQLNGTLMPVRGGLSGEVINYGQLSGQLPTLRATMLGEASIDTTLTGRLAKLQASMAGGHATAGTLAGALRALLFSGLGTHTQSGVLSGGLRPLSAALAGSVKNAVVLDNTADAGYVAGVSTGGQSKTFAYTNYGNCIVVFHTNTTSSTSVTCTYGGVTIPRVSGPTSGGTVFPYTSYCQIFMLISNSLPQGANNVVINNTSQTAVYGVASFKNAGSLSVSSDTSSGNINKSSVPGDGKAAVAGYVGVVTFGTLSPNEILNRPFNAFNTWASVFGYGLDTGSGITFTDPSHIGSKAGAVVTISPP